jgi:hypothetical protein
MTIGSSVLEHEEGIFDVGLRESINSTSTQARQMEEQSLEIDDVFTDRTNMMINP